MSSSSSGLYYYSVIFRKKNYLFVKYIFEKKYDMLDITARYLTIYGEQL